jgi:hypothetical protein
MVSFPNTPRSFRLRISLRALLVAVALFGALFASLAMQWRSAKRQEAALEALRAHAGAGGFTYWLKNYGPDSTSPKQATWAPDWLRERFGPHFFETVRAIDFGDPNNPNRPKSTDEGMELLREFPGLRQLNLLRTEITDRGVEQLEHCPEMHYLSFWDNKHITHEAMKTVKKLRRLHSLSSAGPLNNAEGMAHLKELPQLRELLLCDFRTQSVLNDEALQHIGEMKSLHLLSIQSTTVTDDGLVHLENLPQLKELTLSSTKVTPTGVQRLRRALPNCEITVR